MTVRISLALAVFIILLVFIAYIYFQQIKLILPNVLYSFNLQSLILPKLITCSNCNSFKYSYEIENVDFCGNRDIFLLIVVASHHPNIEERQAIRKTWGSVQQHKGLNISTMFMFGLHLDPELNLQISQESDRYGDVVQAKFNDTYTTLSNKTMAGLEWINKNCAQAKYILKSDDNALQIPQAYVDYLTNIKLQSFIGSYCIIAYAQRKPKSKFYTTYNAYPSVYYPLHCWGPGYVMSSLALKQILAIAPSVTFLPWEDVYVSGICREAAGIPYVHIPGMNVRKRDITHCSVASEAKSLHSVSPSEAVELWTTVNEKHNTCPLLYFNTFM